MDALSNIPVGYTEDGFLGHDDCRRRVIHTCSNCAGDILEGHRYWDAGGGEIYCEDCLNIISVADVIELLGIGLTTAGEYMGD